MPPIPREKILKMTEIEEFKVEEIIQDFYDLIGMADELNSKGATQELVSVIKILKENGIDVSKINSRGTIEGLIEEQDNKVSEMEKTKIIEQLKAKGIVEELNWPIGIRLHEQKKTSKLENFKEALKQELKESKIELTKEEWKKLLEKEKSKDATQELVSVIKILKENGIDVSKIARRGTIEDLIKAQDKKVSEMQRENIEKCLNDIGIEEKLNWPIGSRLNVQKNTSNLENFKETLKKVLEESQIELTRSERKRLVESKDPNQELVSVIKILKENGIDVSKIKSNGTIEDLIEEQDKKVSETQRENIEKCLNDIGIEKKLKLPIGSRLQEMKRTSKLENFKETLKQELKESKIELTKEEWKKLVEKEKSKSKDQTQKLVSVIKILKENGIDVSKIKMRGGTIKDLIQDNNASKKQEDDIKKQLIDIGIGKELNWPIGKRLETQKNPSKLENFKEELKKGLEESKIELTEEEWKKLVGRENSKDATQELVSVIKILKENGIDVSKIARRGTIEDLIKAQDKKVSEMQRENIEKFLNDIRIEEKLNWPIGIRLNAQKKTLKLENFKEALKQELEESKIELTKEEMDRLVAIKPKKSQDVGKATYDAPVEECDKAQAVLDNLVEKTKEGGKAKNE